MRKFYATKRYLVGLGLQIGILALPVGAGFIFVGAAWAVIIGFIILIVSFFPVYVRLAHPLFWIDEQTGTAGKVNLIGRESRVGPIAELSLVISNDYVALRKDGFDRVMVGRQAFSGSWERVVGELRGLGFKEVVQPQ